LAKSVKNEAELAGMLEAHLRDGVAMASFWCWLDEQAAAGKKWDEYEIGEWVSKFRAEQPGFSEESFATIAGEGPHGAIIHYRASKEGARDVGPESLILCDSGGQYDCGTTDVTRTHHLGTPTDHQKDAYTRVLQGHIGLDHRRVPPGHQRVRPRRVRAQAPMGGWAGLQARHRPRRGRRAQRARGPAEHLAPLRQHDGPRSPG
jgi:Xaa-Pro aminopeptidase